MPRHYLDAKEYTSGIEQLTSKSLLHYGGRIVSTALALARLSQRYNRDLDRNILIQKCKRGQLRPMGRLGKKTLYYWTSDIDKLIIDEDKRHAKNSKVAS